MIRLKNFIKTILILYLLLIVDIRGQNDTLKIIQISDTHIVYNLESCNPIFYNLRKGLIGDEDSLKAFFETVPQKVGANAVVITGDIIDFYEADIFPNNIMKIGNQIESLSSTLKMCPVPLYLTLGNHDITSYWVNPKDSSRMQTQAYSDKARAVFIRNIPRFKNGTYYKTNYQVGKTNYHLFFLDNGYYLHDGGKRLDKIQLDWLNVQLGKIGDEPAILFFHIFYSVGDVNGDGIYFGKDKPVDWPKEKDCSKGLLKILNEHKNIKAMFVGHGHHNIWESIHFPKGHTIYQIETGSLGEKRSNWRLIKFTEDKIIIDKPGTQKVEIELKLDRNEFRKTPYLIYPGVNTEYMILWQLKDSLKSVLEWGTNSLYSGGSIVTSEYNSTHQHKYMFKNLLPRTKYYYKVTAGSKVYSSTFYSAPANESDSLKFIAYGDARSNPKKHNRVAERIVETFTNDPEYQSIVISSGDLVKEGNIETQWDEQFFNIKDKYIQKVLGSVGYQAAIGNHERNGLLFGKYFPYPFVEKYYWAFDYGPIHFIMVDQFIASFTKNSKQLKWIENELKTTKKRWKILVLHKPGWSVGHHGGDKKTQEIIQPLCEKYGVKLIIGGHNHRYVRAEVNGVTYITTGGGGAPLDKDNVNKEEKNIILTNVVNHFCKIDIEGNSLIFEAVDSSGKIFDKFTLVSEK